MIELIIDFFHYASMFYFFNNKQVCNSESIFEYLRHPTLTQINDLNVCGVNGLLSCLPDISRTEGPLKSTGQMYYVL